MKGVDVYSPATNDTITVRFRGTNWSGDREKDGSPTIDDDLVELATQAKTNTGWIQVHADLSAIHVNGPFKVAAGRRLLTEKRGTPNSYDSLEGFLQLFKDKRKDAVVEWQKRNVATIIDVDNHQTGVKLDVGKAQYLVPTPVAYKSSRNGGVHCLYVGGGCISAYDMAALASYDVSRVFPEADSVELLTRARCNQAGWIQTSKHFYTPQTVGSYTLDNDAVSEWLSNKGMDSASRHGHDCCPFDSDVGTDTNPSVVVHAEGIYCHRCQRGASWAYFLHGLEESPGPLQVMAHARVWMDQVTGWGRFYEPELLEHLPNAYRMALMIEHGNHPCAFASLMNHGVLRSNTNDWLLSNLRGSADPIDRRNIAGAIRKLPAIRRIPTIADDDPKKLSITELDNLYNSETATLPGVPPVDVGKLSFTVDPDPVPVTENWVWRFDRPKWSYLDDTITLEQFNKAQAIVNRWFPEVDWNYLQLLIVAHLVCRVEPPSQPIIIASTGVSGAGKTNTTKLAAALVDGRANVISVHDVHRDFNRELGSQLLEHPEFIVLDEYLKKDTEDAALCIYELNRLYTFTVKYKNAQTLPVHCPIVLTGLSLSRTFQQSAQFCRRVVQSELYKACDWRDARAANLLETWNDVAARRQAADVICSYLAQKYVLAQENHVEGWLRAVDDLGIDLASDEVTEDSALGGTIRQFVLALSQYSTRVTEGKRVRYILDLDKDNEAVRHWFELCDSRNTTGLYTSDRLQERTLEGTLGASQPVTVRASRWRQNQVVLSFRIKRGMYWELDALATEARTHQVELQGERNDEV